MHEDLKQIIGNLVALAIGITVAFGTPLWLMSDSSTNQDTTVENVERREEQTKPQQSYPKIDQYQAQKQNKQRRCLAKNIYFEARGQSRKGQIAIGLVTLNRVQHKAYPNTVCEVVHQPWQFSWLWTDDQPKRVDEPKAYQTALNIASALLSEESGIKDFTNGATHYHKNTVSPNWEDVKFLFVLGDHIFYRKERG